MEEKQMAEWQGDKGDFQEEAEYFEKVEGIIQRKLEKLQAEKAPLRDQVLQQRKDMWDENRHLIREFDDVILLSAQESSVKLAEDQYERNELEIQRLAKMEKSPYFGRVDFEESGTGERDTIYIGISSLTQEESHEVYVVDWRAPIASMFYQFDLGPAWYEVCGRKTEVELTRKRQYKIEDGRFLSAYDTNSSMYDDILGEVLSEHSDHKLKVIIGSIQQEQNAAIRTDARRSCLIYGLAGSGKTSIGLHRLAYLLYCNKDTISAENILIISNNHIFSSYISTILPDLGEKPVETKVFADFLELYLEEGLEVEDSYTQLKRLEGSASAERIKWLQVKYSADMLQFCIDYFASFSFQVPEVRYGEEVIISWEILGSKLETGHFSTFPSRYERLKHLIKKTIEDFFLLHKEKIYADIMERDEEGLSEKAVKALYRRMVYEYVESAWEEVIRLNHLKAGRQTAEVCARYLQGMPGGHEEAWRLSDSLRRGKLWYEDGLLYLFVKVLMGEIPVLPNIRHIVIDEAQDYNLLQLYIIKKLFSQSSFTLLGDICQTINSLTTIQRYDAFEKVFGPDLVSIRLSKCYRSSSDINALAFSLIGQTDYPVGQGYSYFERAVKKPRYVVCRDMFSCLVPILEELEKYHSVAVIVNSDEEALSVKSYLSGRREAHLIISPEDQLKGGVVIIPLLLAKGLEFDAVVLFGCIHSNEGNRHIRRKVYLGCTRALHELYFVEKDTLPDSLQECGQYMEMVD